MERMQERRPAALLYVRKVHSVDAESASKICRHTAHDLLNLLALRRDDTPRLLGGVIGVTDSQGVTRHVGSWIDGASYGGNLIGGFISGEDPHGLMQFWDGLSTEPRARLWLSLYADAIADQRWDYRLFRCFNLLEGIAAEIVPSNSPILDAQGQPRLQPDGRPYTTREARGKVYELLRTVAAKTQQSELNFTARRTDGVPVELWDEVALWVAVRNAVAHRGTWMLPEGEVPAARHTSTEAQIVARGHDSTFTSGAWLIVNAIRTAVKATLIAALRGLL